MSAPITEVIAQDGCTDFDFIQGRWSVHNRRLRERLKGSDDWQEFDAVLVGRLVLGGIGNVDEMTFDRPSGPIYGMTVRLFDPTTRKWSIYWVDSVRATLEDPMIGEFKEGRGEFYGEDLSRENQSGSASYGP